jgi:hypothetical protein
MNDLGAWPIRVPLARDRWRMAALVVLRAAVGGLGLATGIRAAGTIGIAVLAVSIAVLAYAPVLALWLGTLRAEIRVGRLDLVWALRRQSYPLMPGPITRLRPAERGKGVLEASFRGFGIAAGNGQLDREALTVLRLSHGAPLIAVPTRRGRVAITPADEGRYVAALTRATLRRALLLDFDRVLGLDLARAEPIQAPLPAGASELLERRDGARAARDFATSDALRDELAALGVEVRDTPEGQVPTLRR